MGTELPKQFLPLAGIPILVRTVKAYLTYHDSLYVSLVIPGPHHQRWQTYASQYLTPSEQARVWPCEGGSTRTASVFLGLNNLKARVQQAENCLVAIHDGVRPFITADLLNASYSLAAQKNAAVACVPVKASLRRKIDKHQSQAVDRSNYLEVQTPQTFRLDLILQAYADQAGGQFTDDASLFEAAGFQVPISEGSYDNIKITTPEDLAIAEQIYARRAASTS